MFQVATALAVGWCTHQLCWLLSPLYCCGQKGVGINKSAGETGWVRETTSTGLDFAICVCFQIHKEQVTDLCRQVAEYHQ